MTIYEDEIDLRPYINIVLENWWKIGILAVLLATFVFFFTFLQAPSYQATATILVPRSQLQLSLADQFPTVVDAGDSRSRMDAYLTIARSDAIALKTYQAVKDLLPEEYSIANLQNDVEITNTGDAILITATAPTDQLAADIANEWAQQTVQAINLAYSGEQPLEEIQLQIASATEKYQEAQKELETFIETNPITKIQTYLDLAEIALDAYKDDETWQINYLYQQKHQLTQTSDEATFTRNQVESGNASTAGDVGDALAVMNTRAGTFSSSKSNEFTIQFTDPTTLLDSATGYARDLDTIIVLSDEELQKINQELEVLLSGSYLDADESFSELAADIQRLKAQLESLTAREQELTSERDLAWNTYQLLLQKETEIKTTAQTNDVVTFASPAIPHTEPEAKQTIMKTAIAGMLGAMIGVVWVITRMWWQSNQLEEDKAASSQEA